MIPKYIINSLDKIVKISDRLKKEKYTIISWLESKSINTDDVATEEYINGLLPVLEYMSTNSEDEIEQAKKDIVKLLKKGR